MNLGERCCLLSILESSSTAPTIKAVKEELSMSFCLKEAIVSSWVGKGQFTRLPTMHNPLRRKESGSKTECTVIWKKIIFYLFKPLGFWDSMYQKPHVGTNKCTLWIKLFFSEKYNLTEVQRIARILCRKPRKKSCGLSHGRCVEKYLIIFIFAFKRMWKVKNKCSKNSAISEAKDGPANGVLCFFPKGDKEKVL